MGGQLNNGRQPQPALPPMTVAERRLWAASHNLDERILLIYADEMAAIQQNVLMAGGGIRKAQEQLIAMRGTLRLAQSVLKVPAPIRWEKETEFQHAQRLEAWNKQRARVVAEIDTHLKA